MSTNPRRSSEADASTCVQPEISGATFETKCLAPQRCNMSPPHPERELANACRNLAALQQGSDS